MNQLQVEFTWNLEGIYTEQERETVETFIRKACAFLCQEMNYVPRRVIRFELCDLLENVGIRTKELNGGNPKEFHDSNFILPMEAGSPVQKLVRQALDSDTLMMFDTSTYLFRLKDVPEPDKDEVKSLLILSEIRNSFLPGVERCNKEWESNVNVSAMLDMARERRAIKLFPLMGNLESMLHEFVHACNFEQILDTYGLYKALFFFVVNYDYQTWDDFLSKYWSSLATYKLIPNLEVNMYYSNWIQQMENEKRNFNNVLHMIEMQKEDFRRRGLEKTVQREMRYLPLALQYFLESPYASKDATQMLGLIHSNFEYLMQKANGCFSEERTQKLDSLRLHEDEKNILRLREKGMERSTEYPIFHKSRVVKSALHAEPLMDKIIQRVYREELASL